MLVETRQTRWWAAALFAIGVVIIVGSSISYTAGKRAGREEVQARAASAVAAVEAKYRQQEANHARQVSDLRSRFAGQAAEAAQVDLALSRDFESGRRPFRVRIVRTSCPKSAAPNTSAARVDVTADARLAPAVAADLFGIAADGDAAIRQLTALQEWARSAVNLCNGGDR